MAVYGELNRIVMKKKRSAKDKRRVRVRNSLGRAILGLETNNTNKMEEEKKDPVTEEVKPEVTEGVAGEKVEGVE